MHRGFRQENVDAGDLPDMEENAGGPSGPAARPTPSIRPEF